MLQESAKTPEHFDLVEECTSALHQMNTQMRKLAEAARTYNY